MVHIGTRIQSIRKSKGIKQIELAAKSGISKNFLSDIERGLKKPSMKTTYEISSALDVDISFLTNDHLAELLYNQDIKPQSGVPSGESLNSIMAIQGVIDSNPELYKIFTFLEEYEKDLDRLFQEHQTFYSNQVNRMYAMVGIGINATKVLDENSEQLKIIKEYYNFVKDYNLKRVNTLQNASYAFVKQHVKSIGEQK